MNLFETIAKINWFLAPLVAVLGAASWFHPAVAGSDLWWHLASGRDIWAHLQIPKADPYSWTFGGREWMHHEWLWDAIYWPAYHLHPQAVAWLNLALIIAIFALAYVVAWRESGSRLGAGVALWLAAASAHWFLDIRPHLTSLLLVSAFLLTRERSWAPWMWPPMMVVWCNLHGGFAFGYGMIGLYALMLTIRRSLAQRRIVVPWPEWFGVAGTSLALLVNPWGYRILEYPIAYLDSSSPFRQLVEWLPPRFVLGLWTFEGRFWLIAGLAGAGTGLTLLGALPRVRRWLADRRLPALPTIDPYLIALSLVCFQMAATSRRFIPLFGIVSASLVAATIGHACDLLVRRFARLSSPAAASATTLASLALAAWLWSDVRLYPDPLERWTDANLYPEAGLRYLRALAPGEKLLNYYNWGGYIMLHAPEFKLFIDGRANTLYGEDIYNDYQEMLRAAPGLAERVERYPADAALLPISYSPLARALASPPLNWVPVYADQLAVVLLPPGSPRLHAPLPYVEQVVGDTPDFFLERGVRRMQGRDYEAAERDIRAAIAKSPLLVRGYAQLAALLASTGRVDQIRREIDAAIALEPRRRPQLRTVEGSAYEAAGDPVRAVAAYREGIPSGPFAYRGDTERRIASLEAQIARGDVRGSPSPGR